jgi:hypothetical protein
MDHMRADPLRLTPESFALEICNLDSSRFECAYYNLLGRFASPIFTGQLPKAVPYCCFSSNQSIKNGDTDRNCAFARAGL